MIYNDPNETQKRLQGKMAGSRGVGYAEIFPDKKLEKLLKEIRRYLDNLLRKKKPPLD